MSAVPTSLLLRFVLGALLALCAPAGALAFESEVVESPSAEVLSPEAEGIRAPVSRTVWCDLPRVASWTVPVHSFRANARPVAGPVPCRITLLDLSSRLNC